MAELGRVVTRSVDIRDGVVLSGHVASGQIGSSHIASAAVLSGHVASGQIESSHLFRYFYTTAVISDAEQSIAHGLGAAPAMYGAVAMSGAVIATPIIRGVDATYIYARGSVSGGIISVWAIK
jgi:hypothetical protein